MASRVEVRARWGAGVVIWNWVADASGTVTIPTADPVFGRLARVEIDPGSPAPTASYGIVINDEQGVDVLNGDGAALSATVTAAFVLQEHDQGGSAEHTGEMVVADVLSLVVSAAGAAAEGVVKLYYEYQPA